MPSDYGDDAGEMLVDWMRKIAEDAGEQVMLSSAERLSSALHNLRGGPKDAPIDDRGLKHWAKLNMHEFKELPEFDSIKHIISIDLNKNNVQHAFEESSNGTYLIFRINDAPKVNSVVESIELSVEKACNKVLNERGLKHISSRDLVPLEVKAKEARESSKAIEGEKRKTLQLEKTEVKSR